MGLGPLENGGRVIGMHQPAPVIEMIADLVILVAKNLFENRIHVDLAGRQIPVPDADAACRRRAPVAIVSVHGVRAPSADEIAAAIAAINVTSSNGLTTVGVSIAREMSRGLVALSPVMRTTGVKVPLLRSRSRTLKPGRRTSTIAKLIDSCGT